jgi:hypothetical protein
MAIEHKEKGVDTTLMHGSDLEDWKHFFEQNGKERVLCAFYEDAGPLEVCTVEELYQHFKGRLLHELTRKASDDPWRGC